MRRALLLGWLTVTCAVVHAASLQISPVTVDLQPNENAIGITLRNPGDHPLYGQVRIFKWDQTSTDDTLTPTQDLIASPPLIEVAPQGEQMVRLVRQAAGPSTTEQTYRILVDEIPQPDTAAASGVTIRLRYSVPVFVEPAGAIGKPELSWHLVRDAQGWSLRVTNTGIRRGQISAVQLVDAGKTYMISKGLLGYALAGRTHQWRIDPGHDVDPHGALKIRANVNALPSEAPVAIDPRP